MEQYLPIVFYYCAQLPNRDIIAGVRDTWGNFWQLSSNDVLRCLNGQLLLRRMAQRHHMSLSLDILRTKCSNRQGACLLADEQGVEHLRKLDAGLRVYVEDANVFHPSWRGSMLFKQLCADCRKHVEARSQDVCDKAWNSLADCFDVTVKWPIGTGQ